MIDLKDYCIRLGSSDPVPGGGSAAALALSLGASTVEKAVRFSLNDFTKEFIGSLEEIRDAGFQLSQDDQTAFKGWQEARRLPKETPQEKQAREEKVNYFTEEVIVVPLNVARQAAALMGIIMDFVPHCNKWLLSDAAVGASFAGSAFESALFNIDINLPYLKNEELKKQIDRFLTDTPSSMKEMKESVYKLCRIK
jgi:formiminotetrahydrofolate cyclodeaminase